MRPVLPACLALSACLAPTTPSGTTDTGGPVCAADTIGPAGGALAIDGVSVTFDAGVVATDTAFELCLSDAPPTGLVARSKVATLTPALELPVPATVSLPWSDAGGALYTPDPTGAPALQLRSEVGAEGTTGALYRTGVFLVAEEARVVEPFAGGPIGDLLFVVDDSGSMDDEQRVLAAEVGAVLGELDAMDLDYRAGVTTTDCDTAVCGLLRQTASDERWVEPTTPDVAAAFAVLAMPGTSGSSTERGADAVASALAEPQNTAFFRDEAQLAVIVVSDEPDLSRAGGTDRAITALQDAEADPAWVTFHTVTDPLLGGRYELVRDAIGGRHADVRDAEWRGFVDGMVAGMATYPRMRLPGADPATVEVWALPHDGSEPALAVDAGFDPATATVWVGGAGLPTDADLVVVFLPAPL